MDPNVNLQDSEHTSNVDNVLGYRDLCQPEQIQDKIYPEYIEDEWDNISGDIVLFV
jgi:hypothetical protein